MKKLPDDSDNTAKFEFHWYKGKNCDWNQN